MSDRAASDAWEDGVPGGECGREVRVVVVGASAGGIGALRALVGCLPPDLPAAVLVVVHIPATLPSSLPRVLTAAGPLRAAHPEDGEPIRPGRIYVAPPDRHLLVEPGASGGSCRVRLSAAPRENFSRPAIDPLFRSAARSSGRLAAGVILSGALDDGVAGLAALGGRGGLTIAQEPGEALFPSMPVCAIRRVAVDFVLPVAGIAALLARWAAAETLR